MRLSLDYRNLIYSLIYNEVQKNDPRVEREWVELHAFDSSRLFCLAMKRFVLEKFDRLSQDEKNAAYDRISAIAQADAVRLALALEWGKRHAFDHVLWLLDAMDF